MIASLCGACLFSKGKSFEATAENNLLNLVFEKLFPPASFLGGRDCISFLMLHSFKK